MTQAPYPPHENSPHGMTDQGQNVSQQEMLQARQVALQILQQVFTQRHTLDQALDDTRGFAQLNQRDRAFVRMLVTTVVRRLGQIDDVIRRSLSRPDQPLNPPVLEQILRLGAAQIIFMNIPDHAAVNTSVLLIEAEGHGRIKGFVNALMRRMASEGREWASRQDVARLNTPDWLLKIWIEDYGLKHAIDIAQANLHEAPLDISFKSNVRLESVAEALEGTILSTGSLRLKESKMVQDIPGFQDGSWWVQDASAAIPVTLFKESLEGQNVVDLCAAPGGKTAQLASRGAKVLSVDRSAKRLQRLQENMKRLKLEDKVKIEVADAAVWKSREKFSYILLDAPCTATGTVRRNPDVMWMKSYTDLESLVELKSRLLDNALLMLADGGTLIYCTCSLQKSEGEHQIEKLLSRNPYVVRDPVYVHELGGLSDCVTPRGDVRILPYHLGNQGGMDGFFIARLKKNKA
jgi:16S rRNA (cytosine967-C5)-methyltransferase